MRRIKNFFSAIFFAIILIAGLTFFTLENESKHAKDCESLGVTCEKGKIARTTQELWTDLKAWIATLNL